MTRLDNEPVTGSRDQQQTEPAKLAAHDSPRDKHALRARARQLRAATITPDEQGAELSRSVARRIADSEEFRTATTVLTYLAFGSEVNLDSLTEVSAETEAKRFAVPLTHAPDSHLTFHLLAGADLRTSRSGFREPLAAAPQVSLHEVDMVLVPGLAFDARGTRLGYGKGFYDRFLAELLQVGPRVPTVGVTIDALVFDALPSDPHDVPVSHLVTESRLWRCEPDHA